MIHRYFAMAIGVLIIAQMLIAWTARIRRRPLHVSPWWPTGILMLIVVQGAFGAWTVTMKLQPVIVTIHLLLGLALLGSLGWLAARQTPMPVVEPAVVRWMPAALFGLVLLVIQIALGGWVSTNYAVLACTDFPLCNGAVDSADELRARLSPLARARHDRRWRGHLAGRARRDPLDPQDLCRGRRAVHAVAGSPTATFRLAENARERRVAFDRRAVPDGACRTSFCSGRYLLPWPTTAAPRSCCCCSL